MSAGIWRLVRDRDRLFNSPRQLEVTARPAETKRICVQCRRVPDEYTLVMAWLEADSRRTWRDWPGLNGKCPECGGMLAEVTW